MNSRSLLNQTTTFYVVQSEKKKKFITEHTTNKQIEIEVAGRSGTDKINIGSDRDNKQPDFIIESHDL